MKAQVIKSTEPVLENQVIILGTEKDVKGWWNQIALCILTRIKYCIDNGYNQTAKNLREMYDEINEQIKQIKEGV